MKFWVIFISLYLWIPQTGHSQEPVFGSWQGKMSTTSGNYIFNLDLRPDQSGSGSMIKAVAIHDRNGNKQVMELEGILYQDQSIYLVDIGDPYTKIRDGETFSRLQFRFIYENGDLVLDGHWQEYEDLRRYRKGRLVLRKQKAKA